MKLESTQSLNACYIAVSRGAQHMARGLHLATKLAHLMFQAHIFAIIFIIASSYHLSFLFHTSLQYHFHHYSIHFLLIATCPHTHRCRDPFLLAFLLLSSDIELNPGPTNFTVCTLNICSILTDSHFADLSGLTLFHALIIMISSISQKHGPNPSPPLQNVLNEHLLIMHIHGFE